MANNTTFEFESGTPAGVNTEYDELIHELQDRRDYWKNRREVREGFAQAERAVNYIQGAGKFIIPRHNTWAAHHMLVTDPIYNLDYSPSSYPFFDQRIHERVDYAPFYDAADRKYAAYDVLRENVAIMRNYVMSEFFPDGSVDKEDQRKVRQMAQIADFIGNGLNNDRLLRNPFKPRISMERANMPGTGAQYLYEQIKKQETYYNWMMPILLPIYFVTGRTYKNWGLPSLEDSPFSDHALRQPPPTSVQQLSDEELLDLCSRVDKGHAPHSVSHAYAEGLNQIGDGFAHASHMQQGVDSLQEPTKRESVELAKEILRKLKVKIGEALINNGLTPVAVNNFTILESLKGVVQVYEYHLQKLALQDNHILENPAIRQAADAIGKFGFVAKMEALRIAESSQDTSLVRALREELLRLPAHWQHPKELKFKELLGQIESGMDTVVMRMAQLADHDPTSQAWLGFDKKDAPLMMDTSMERKSEPLNKAMQNDAYFRDLNAQRLQNQAAQQANAQSVTARNQQSQGMAQSPAAAASRTPSPAGNNKMGSLIDDASVATLRNSMKTDPNAAAVKVAQQQRQAIINRERERRAQAERQSKMKTVEAVNRANQRDDKQALDQIEAPLSNPNKKNPTRGI